MESQKIINLLEQSDEDDLNLREKKWYLINDQNNGQYGKGNQNDSTIKFSTENLKSFFVDYSETYILVTGNITVLMEIITRKLHLEAVSHLLDQLFI